MTSLTRSIYFCFSFCNITLLQQIASRLVSYCTEFLKAFSRGNLFWVMQYVHCKVACTVKCCNEEGRLSIVFRGTLGSNRLKSQTTFECIHQFDESYFQPCLVGFWQPWMAIVNPSCRFSSRRITGCHSCKYQINYL